MLRASAVRRVAKEKSREFGGEYHFLCLGELLNCVPAAETRKHILLDNLPRTALPADIRRTTRREKLVGVDDGEPTASTA